MDFQGTIYHASPANSKGVMVYLGRYKTRKRLLILIVLVFCVFGVLYCYYDWGTQWQLYQLATRKTQNPGGNFKVIEHMPFPGHFKGKQLEFHQVFEPRKVSFVGYNYTDGSGNRKGKPKTILLATPWNGVWTTINYYFLRPDDLSFTLYRCPNSRCVVTKDPNDIEEADAVLFHLLDLPAEFPKYRRLDQTWIIYIMEAPWQVRKYNINLTRLDGLFNWTMSYRDDSDVRVKYGFVDERIEDQPNPSTVPDNRVPFLDKKSIVWFVSDCKVDSRREDYVNELKKYVDVDVYGSCGTKKCFPSQSTVCYEDILKSYKFYLSFENSICQDYVTEKYFNILEFDVVPIVFGGADYGRIGPPGAYVNAMDFPDPKNLANHLQPLLRHETLYSRYLDWKSTYRSYLYPWMCYLCDKLHSPVKKTVKRNLQQWWMNDSKCNRWTKDKGFISLP